MSLGLWSGDFLILSLKSRLDDSLYIGILRLRMNLAFKCESCRIVFIRTAHRYIDHTCEIE